MTEVGKIEKATIGLLTIVLLTETDYLIIERVRVEGTRVLKKLIFIRDPEDVVSPSGLCHELML